MKINVWGGGWVFLRGFEAVFGVLAPTSHPGPHYFRSNNNEHKTQYFLMLKEGFGKAKGKTRKSGQAQDVVRTHEPGIPSGNVPPP